MIKTLFTLVLSIFMLVVVYGQIIDSGRIDSLRSVIDHQEDDTTKVKLLAEYSFQVVFAAPEQALSFAQEGLLLANSLNYKRGQILCNISVGFTKWINSDYTESTEIFLQCLNEAESIKDTDLYGRALDGVVASYRDHGNYREALRYCFKGIKLFDQSPYVKVWTGSVYNAMKMPDSALYFFLPIDKSFGRQFKGYTLFEIGKAYHQKKELSKALQYYNLSIDTLDISGNIKDLALAHNGKAELYTDMGNLDSCIYYAKRGLDISKKLGYKKGAYESYLLLSTAFESDNKTEALLYYKLAMEVKDDIFNIMNQTRAISARFTTQLQQIELEKEKLAIENRIRTIILTSVLIVFIVIVLLFYRIIRIKQKAKQRIENAFDQLRSTQSQLIQSEKMASLGELTAGIAHEIQNPLNFVNNFSEVNKEMIGKMKEEISKGNYDEVKIIADDIEANEEKINHHGQRASGIVKAMLEHSRAGEGKKELTDINALCDEYLRLAYHGMRAKDKSFNVGIETDFDPSLPKVEVVPQEIGRVLLNLINNGFYACNERRSLSVVEMSRSAVAEKKSPREHVPLENAKDLPGIQNRKDLDEYHPTVTVSTKLSPAGVRKGVMSPSGGGLKGEDSILITVSDNGSGIPAAIKDKIFQPFFTTKPTGKGTGLGLSLSYDIIKAHGGELRVESKEGEGTVFTIQLLPISKTKSFNPSSLPNPPDKEPDWG